MRNICVITGAPCFGMHKVVQFLDERGVSLINLQGASGKRTEKEEDIVLRYTAEDETNIVLTREDIKHRVLVLTTEQTELLMQSVKTSSGSRAGNKLNVVQFIFLRQIISRASPALRRLLKARQKRPSTNTLRK